MQVGVRASMLGPVKFGVERDRLRAACGLGPARGCGMYGPPPGVTRAIQLTGYAPEAVSGRRSGQTVARISHTRQLHRGPALMDASKGSRLHRPRGRVPACGCS